MKKRTLLINTVFWSPVGHVIDALKFAKGFYNANKNLEISLIFNKNSPAEIAKLCPWVKKFYTVDRREIGRKGEKANTYSKIPKNWDYIMDNNQIIKDCKFKKPKKDCAERDMFIHFEVSKEIFKARISRGELYPKVKLPKGLKRIRDSKTRFQIPKKNIEFVKQSIHKGKKIGIMLGGSAGLALYPSVNSWIKIIEAINKRYPNCKIYLTGVKKSIDGRTATQSYNEKDINLLKRKFKNLIDCYDIGLFNQIALLKNMDVFISPHTGFAFLASCVNTPWLEIAGGDWSMYLWNHCPFYTVLPNDKKYPHMGGLENLKYKKSPKIPGMSDKELEKKIPEIMKGLKLLVEKKINYKQSLKIYNEKVRKSQTNLKSMGEYPWHFY